MHLRVFRQHPPGLRDGADLRRLLMFFTVADVATRFRRSTPAGAPFGTERSQPEGLLEHELPED